jgi:hypothetical protein
MMTMADGGIAKLPVQMSRWRHAPGAMDSVLEAPLPLNQQAKIYEHERWSELGSAGRQRFSSTMAGGCMISRILKMKKTCPKTEADTP